MRFLSVIILNLSLIVSAPVLAHEDHKQDHKEEGGKGHHFEPNNEAPKLEPAGRFAGTTAIDLKNGRGFNNGTYGVDNPEVKKYALAPTWAVSLSDLGYPYENKDRFVSTLDERIAFFEQAVWNWARVSDITKPEVKEYAAKSTADISPRIERARSAWSKAKSAGRADWDKASEEAKHAFLDLQSFYYSLHKNVSK